MNGFRVRDRVFSGGTHIMGILNLTPDSFYAPSRAGDDVARRALEMLSDGAEIIDIGGQSTRPGHGEVSALEELARVLPAVAAIREVSDCILSVDTYYPEIAEAVLDAGADMINDVSGLRYKGLAEAVAARGASICLMHNRRESGERDLMTDKLTGLIALADKAERAGIARDAVLLDGGIGFNKSADEDWYLLDHYEMLAAAGYPLLLGTSRKSMFGGAPESRLTATMESSALAAKKGILFVRVHDVRENLIAIRAAKGERL